MCVADVVRQSKEKNMSTKRLPPEFGESGQDTKLEAGQRELTRRDFVKIASAVGAVGAAIGGSELFTSTAAAAPPKPPKTKIDTPVISCAGSTAVSINILVCAGGTGLPAGFSIQWMTAADYALSGGWPTNSDCPLIDSDGDGVPETPTCPASFCKASFSGNANLSRYNLAANECVTVNIGEFLFDEGASTNCPNALDCGTEYVFRAFGHATSSLMRSDFTGNLACSTIDCNDQGGCTFTQGYWKTHGPTGCSPGNNTNAWPVASLTLGNVLYTDLELCNIFNTAASGNGLLALAHQLIAAKLNVASGADDTDVAANIAAADALIADLIVPPVGAGSLAPSVTGSLTASLASYNEGATGPGHCD
jgi:hypothetical protein